MSYIDRKAAKELMEQALVDEWEIQYADDRLDEIPAADVVERKPITTNADKIRATIHDIELAQEIWSCRVFDRFSALVAWLKADEEVRDDRDDDGL